MTEDALIAALSEILGPAAPRRVLLGIGDDAAVWQPSRSHRSVVTTDALVDGVHFDAGRMEAAAVGHRVLAANLSDVAAMGARPLLATIALGVPPGFDEAWILDAYRGIAALATRARCAIAGGDVVRAPALFFSVTVVGEVAPRALRLRSTGRPGDVVAVTGTLGASRAGLELMRRPELARRASTGDADAVRTAFERPEPRLREAAWLAASVHVHAMMDLSDGLATDLGRLAAASACAASVHEVPVAPAARAIAELAGDDARAYALDGGEDFELLVAIDARAFRHLGDRFASRFGRPLLAVGRLQPGTGLTHKSGGDELPLIAAGYSHLGPESGEPL